MAARPRTRLIGRSSELAELENEFRQAARGSARLILLVGDPGIGKTALAAELLKRLRMSAACLAARAYPLGVSGSFGLWLEAFEGYLSGLSTEQIKSICGGFLDDLSSLCPSIAAAGGVEPAPKPSRLRIVRGLVSICRNLSRQRPVAIFLDDIHLADASSIHALSYIARNLSNGQLLFVLAARPAELAENELAFDALLRLEQDGLLRRLDLPPLRKDHLGELARAILDDHIPPAALVEWLAERSRGYPLFALGLLRALLEEGADLSSPRLHRLPESLSARAVAGLHRLTGEDRAILEVLAVLQHRIELASLAHVSNQALGSLAPVVERLVRSRLVTEEEVGSDLFYEVAHPLIQQAIYEGMGGARRRLRHRQVAHGLVAADRLAAAAPHFALSADVGDPTAIDALRRAVSQAQDREAHQEALVILTALLAIVPPGDTRWLELLPFLAWQCAWITDYRPTGDLSTMPGALNEIGDILDGSADFERQGVVQYCRSVLLDWDAGDLEAAELLGRNAQQLFVMAGRSEQARLAGVHLAWIRGHSGHLAEQEAMSEDILAAAEAAADHPARVQALFCLGHALMWEGRFRECERAIRLSIDIAHEDRTLHRHGMGMAVLAMCLAFEGRMTEALRVVRDGRFRNPFYADTSLLDHSARIHMLAGQFEAAIADAREAASGRRGLGRRRAWSLAIAALSAAEMGKMRDANGYLAEASDAYGGRPWYAASYHCIWAEGLLAARSGELRRALDLLQGAASDLMAMGALPLAGFVLIDLAEIAAEVDDRDTGAWTATKLSQIAQVLDRDLYRSLAALGRAYGETVNSAQASQAEALLRDTGYAAYQARALELLGRTLAGSDRPGAIATLVRAAGLYEACGAAWRQERVVRVLAGLGRPARRTLRAGQGVEALTPRERDVARLAAEGRTARQIAEQLHIGKRTVESHLASTYAKLGVGSQLELVRKAVSLKV